MDSKSLQDPQRITSDWAWMPAVNVFMAHVLKRYYIHKLQLYILFRKVGSQLPFPMLVGGTKFKTLNVCPFSCCHKKLRFGQADGSVSKYSQNKSSLQRGFLCFFYLTCLNTTTPISHICYVEKVS